ncbi:MAG: hypothetical protein ACYTGR_07615 [Planctomycetota bacterium]|jgi:hypothetical protein
MAKTKVLICPYCGETQPAGERCSTCGGLFEALSRQASHNAMGPWFVRDMGNPNQPGCSYETLTRLIERERVTKYSIVRGPTTKQFWTVGKRVPGIAHLFGYCHHCDASVDPGDHGCHACGVPFGAYLDRNFLGLPDVRPLPWEADVDADGDAIVGGTRMDSLSFARRGLSSFASDDELLRFDADEARVTPDPVPGHSAETLVEDSTDSVAMAASAGVAATETDVTIRALRRRLERARRTNSILLVAVIALAGTIAAMLAASMSSAGSPPADSNQPGLAGTMSSDPAVEGPAPAEPTPLGDAEADTVTDSDSDSETDTGESDAAVAGEPMPAPAVDGADGAPLPAEDRDFDPAADLVRAAEHVAASARADRAVTDRIGDLELAISLMKRVLEQAPEAGPEDLGAQIERLDSQLERLKLEAFFPSGL